MIICELEEETPGSEKKIKEETNAIICQGIYLTMIVMNTFKSLVLYKYCKPQSLSVIFILPYHTDDGELESGDSFHQTKLVQQVSLFRRRRRNNLHQ